jgi:pyruvate/2-oxoglutarate dehydrogenase complex dihydrolipoamide dehydrogenase (E3) component
VSDRIAAYALYIDPPLGRAGLTEAEVRKTGRSALMGKRPMTKVGRAVEKGETQGFMKIVVDAQTREILGAAIWAPVERVIHSILDVMCKASYTVIQRAVHFNFVSDSYRRCSGSSNFSRPQPVRAQLAEDPAKMPL